MQTRDLPATDKPPHLGATDRQSLSGLFDAEEHSVGGAEGDVDDLALTTGAPGAASLRWHEFEAVHGLGLGHQDLQLRGCRGSHGAWRGVPETSPASVAGRW